MFNNPLENILNLRKVMQGSYIDSYIVPHHDENFSEYVPKNKERLYWVSGFSGSAGTLLITKKKLFLFTDGRYILQAKNQTKNLNCQIIDTAVCTLNAFLKDTRVSFKNIGICSKTISLFDYNNLLNITSKNNIRIKIINKSLIDVIWKRNLNTQDASKAFFLSNKYCGEDSSKKLKRTSNYLTKKNADFIFTQNSESIAWLFNMRGKDLTYTPLMFCNALIGKNEQKIFFEDKNFPHKIKKYFPKNTKIYSYTEMSNVLKKSCSKSTKIIIDQKNLSLFNFNLLKKITNKFLLEDDILLPYRSIKNLTEIKSSKKAHLFDAVALCKFLYWYKTNKGVLFELDVVNKVNSLRELNPGFISLSFPTIAGAGKNGAIIHYQPNKKTNKKINKSDILLLDSGGQYFTGTTDVTRTITRNKNSSKKIIRDYTIVLKSHINLYLSKFPKGVPGSFLDATARKILWDNGEDFAHSTGHGVGFCLNVHEGPFSISLKNLSPIYENMIFSNEPGIYKNGKYGIRIENLVFTKEISFNLKKFLALETLTLVPYEKTLIDNGLLNTVEKNWLNSYHKKVIKNVSPFLNKKEKEWLKKECKEI